MVKSATALLAEALAMRQSEYYQTYLADPDKLSNKEHAVMGFFETCLGNSRKSIEHLMDRTDGPLATPVQIIYPKVYYKFPYIPHDPERIDPSVEQKMYSEDDTTEDEEPEDLSPLSGLRDTIRRMSNETVELRNSILETYEMNLHQLPLGATISPDLLMASVVAANFLRLSSSPAGAMSLFDQLDGKIATVFQAMGGDMYLLDTSTTLPHNAYWDKTQNSYVLEAPNTTNQWTDALKLLEQ